MSARERAVYSRAARSLAVGGSLLLPGCLCPFPPGVGWRRPSFSWGRTLRAPTHSHILLEQLSVASPSSFSSSPSSSSVRQPFRLDSAKTKFTRQSGDTKVAAVAAAGNGAQAGGRRGESGSLCLRGKMSCEGATRRPG